MQIEEHVHEMLMHTRVHHTHNNRYTNSQTRNKEHRKNSLNALRIELLSVLNESIRVRQNGNNNEFPQIAMDKDRSKCKLEFTILIVKHFWFEYLGRV